MFDYDVTFELDKLDDDYWWGYPAESQKEQPTADPEQGEAGNDEIPF